MTHLTYHFRALFLYTIINVALSTQTRKLTVSFNPDCDTEKCHSPTHNNLVYIRAEGTNDTVHYVWATIQQPTLLIARTEPEASLWVDWSKCCDSLHVMLNFSLSPLYLFHTTFDQLLEFTDPNDTAKLPDANYTTSLDLSALLWPDANSSIQVADGFVSADFKIFNLSFDGSPPNGSFSLTLRVFDSDGLTPRLPNLPHSATTAQLLVDLDNLLTTTEKDRLAMVMSVGYSGNSSTQLRHSVTSSMDDEYSPGVFKDIIIKDDSRGFAYWKPAAYLSSDHSATKTTNVNLYIPQEDCTSQRVWELELHRCAFNVSFGMPEDGFYAKSAFTSWTLEVGLGPAPKSQMSLLAYVILSVGLGVPTVLFIAALIYITLHRLRRRSRKLEEKLLIDPSASH